MTDGEIQSALDLIDSALGFAMNAERWSLSASNNDPTGRIHHAWRNAQETVVILQRLKQQLQVAIGS